MAQRGYYHSTVHVVKSVLLLFDRWKCCIGLAQSMMSIFLVQSIIVTHGKVVLGYITSEHDVKIYSFIGQKVLVCLPLVRSEA